MVSQPPYNINQLDHHTCTVITKKQLVYLQANDDHFDCVPNFNHYLITTTKLYFPAELKLVHCLVKRVLISILNAQYLFIETCNNIKKG